MAAIMASHTAQNGLGLANNCPACGPLCQNNIGTLGPRKLPFCPYNPFRSTRVSVLPQTHPNPSVSFTISFTWGLLLNANNCCLATKYSPCRNRLDYYFFPSFIFLKEKKKIFVIWSLQIPGVHKQWCALQTKYTTLWHLQGEKCSTHITGMSRHMYKF